MTIPVLFKPSATGNRSAAVLITDNASGSPHSAAISGTGTPAQPESISVSPAGLVFPDQPTGTSSAGASITVTNNSSSTRRITALTCSGANMGDFSTTAVAPITLAANGGKAVIPVKFRPSASGARSASLTITDDSGGSAHTVSLSGNGAITAGAASLPLSPDASAHSATLTWQTNAPQIIGHNVYRSSTSGSGYTKLNSTPVVTVSYVDFSVLAGQTYYYVVTVIDSAGNESGHSNEVVAVIPTP